MEHRLEAHAAELASRLDDGQGAPVARALSAELPYMNERDFRCLITAIDRREQKGWGDDLSITATTGYNGELNETISIDFRARDQWGRPTLYRERIAAFDAYPVSPQYREYPYQNYQPYQTRYGGYRIEDAIIPTVVELGLGFLFNNGRHNRYGGGYFPQALFYPQSYNYAPNFYQSYHRFNRFGW
ncbi:MAG: hypothetical protein IT342_24725 [Candidatus Melainabacteria bacterium]|nr:hypothetical protein [Candidatus Melainabacteria bacterium]